LTKDQADTPVQNKNCPATGFLVSGRSSRERGVNLPIKANMRALCDDVRTWIMAHLDSIDIPQLNKTLSKSPQR